MIIVRDEFRQRRTVLFQRVQDLPETSISAFCQMQFFQEVTDPPVPVASDERFTTTVEKIRKLTGDAKLVILDPIYPFVEGRLSNNDDTARAMHNFDIVARETGAAFILLNNLTKNGSSDIDAGIGASNLKNIARSLFKIDRDGPALYIEGVKNNIAPYRGRIGLLFDRYGRIDYIRYSQLEDAIGEAAGLESSGHNCNPAQ